MLAVIEHPLPIDATADTGAWLDEPEAETGHSSRRRRRLAAVTALVAVLALLDAGWIHAKAALAQALLQRAWTQTLADGEAHRPWPWADTEPVARLQAPSLGEDQIVLAGDSGRVLAFGPGWAPASAMPGSEGRSVISGHRDTHFAWLQRLTVGDRLRVVSQSGTRDYRVVDTTVVDAREQRIDLAHANEELLLVTCWPFDAVAAGGPLRYVVTALPESVALDGSVAFAAAAHQRLMR